MRFVVRIRTLVLWALLILPTLLAWPASAGETGGRMGGIGVNYFDVFWKRLIYPKDVSYSAKFQELAKAEVPFVRFAATPYWPDDMQRILRDHNKWLATLDDIVSSASRAGVALVPCVIMNYRTLPDAVGEPIESWGDPLSRTNQAMRTLTAALVGRYKDSSAILAWEFSGEMNSFLDLPDGQRYMQLDAKRGTPDHRTEHDRVQNSHIAVAYREFAKAVREAGGPQLLSTGNDAPRADAMHLARGLWQKDSRHEFILAFERDTPAEYALGSIHLYPDRVGSHAWIPPGSIRLMVGSMVQAVRDTGKIPFIGEFGVQKSGDPVADKAKLGEFLDEIVASCTPLSALWVFDFEFQEATWNVSFSNERRYQLEMLAVANARLRAECGDKARLQ